MGGYAAGEGGNMDERRSEILLHAVEIGRRGRKRSCRWSAVIGDGPGPVLSGRTVRKGPIVEPETRLRAPDGFKQPNRPAANQRYVHPIRDLRPLATDRVQSQPIAVLGQVPEPRQWIRGQELLLAGPPPPGSFDEANALAEDQYGRVRPEAAERRALEESVVRNPQAHG